MKPLAIGLCSWCTHQIEEPALRSAMKAFGINVLHLGLMPLLALEPSEQTHAIAQFRASPLEISAGMIGFPGEDYSSLATIHATGGLVPDQHAEERLALAAAGARVAHQLNLRFVSTHVGFIPGKSDRAAFDKLLTRLARLAETFASRNLTLLFETGQETAGDLADFLTALAIRTPNVGANFDPGNMILYGKGDPVAAVHTLGKWIKHVHAKDASLSAPPPADPAAWRGTEAPLGQGDARLPEVIAALKSVGYTGPLVIEREAGTQDILTGIAFLRPHA